MNTLKEENLLYFPKLSLDRGAEWLKYALLYWDKIGVIVPNDLNTLNHPNYEFTLSILM